MHRKNSGIFSFTEVSTKERLQKKSSLPQLSVARQVHTSKGRARFNLAHDEFKNEESRPKSSWQDFLSRKFYLGNSVRTKTTKANSNAVLTLQRISERIER